MAAADDPEGEAAVSVARPTVEAAPLTQRRRRWAGTKTAWLVLGCYLLGAFAVTSRLWLDPASRVQIFGSFTDQQDVNLFALYMRAEATAIAHGRLPALASTVMNAPHGFSMMWNTSLLLPGVVLSPVTLLAGPQVTLTLLLTLGFAGSAASMFLVLRRWGASVIAAALGGAVYGFSPALINSGFGHYHLQFAVLPPLIIDALLRLVTGRGRPVWTGIWLGLLTAAQIFIGEELLIDTAVAAAVLVVIVAAGRPRAVPGRILATAAGLLVAAAVTLVICGHALLAQFTGPLKEQGSPWRVYRYFARPIDFVTPPGNLLFHTPGSAATAAANYQTTLAEYLGYLGVPLLVLLVAAAITYWRDPRIRAAALTCVILEIFTLGENHAYLPWHYVQHMQVIGQLLPDRLAILADGAAAAVLAFSLDRARAKLSRFSDWRTGLATGAAVLAVLPLISMPYQAVQAAPVPPGWQAVFARLRLAPSASVLIVPIPYDGNTYALRWQAETGDPSSMIGGYFIGPDRSGHAAPSPGLPRITSHIDAVWASRSGARVSVAWLRSTIATRRPAAVVTVASAGSRIVRLLTQVLGRPTFHIGMTLAWRR